MIIKVDNKLELLELLKDRKIINDKIIIEIPVTIIIAVIKVDFLIFLFLFLLLLFISE